MAEDIYTPEQVAAATEQVAAAERARADPLETAQAGLEGFARQATFGLSDAAAAGLVGMVAPDVPRAAGPGLGATLAEHGAADAVRADIAGREERHPTAALAGGALGVLAPAALTGGATGLGRAALAATPAGATSMLAAKLGAGVAAKFGGGVLGTLAAGAAIGATEVGVASGVNQLADEMPQWDADPGESAERIFLATASGAGVGALGGLILGAPIAAGKAIAGSVRAARSNATTQAIARAEATAHNEAFGSVAGMRAVPAAAAPGIAERAGAWAAKKGVREAGKYVGDAALGWVPRSVRDPVVDFAVDRAAPYALDALGALGTLAERKRALVARSLSTGKQIAQMARRAVARAAGTGVASLTGEGSKDLPPEVYERGVADAVALGDPQSPESLQLAETEQALDQVEPGLGTSWAAIARRRSEYFAARLPKTPGEGAVFAGTPAVDPLSQRQLRRAVEAAYVPMRAIGRVSSGLAGPTEVDAVKALAPRVWAAYTSQVAEQLGRSAGNLTRSERRRLALLTGISVDPGDRAESTQLAQQMAATEPEEQEQAPKRGRFKGKFGMSVRDTYATRADRLMTGAE